MTEQINSPSNNDDCLHFPPVLIILSFYSFTEQQIFLIYLIFIMTYLQHSTAEFWILIVQKVFINVLLLTPYSF